MMTDWTLQLSSQIPDDFDTSSIGKACYPAQRWPPDRARVRERAIFVGFPGIHRQQVQGAVVQGTGLFHDKVASSSSRHFVIAHEETRSVYKFDESLADFGPTGGVSGAPVFLEREDGLELCGHIYEGGDSSEATFFAAHSDFIDEYGHIDTSGGMPLSGSTRKPF